MNHAPDTLPILVLYPHSRCNCRCVMCDIWKATAETEISAADLERHMADLLTLQVEWVIFSGGEPLMHRDLFRLAELLARNNIRTTLLTTGLLLARYAAETTAYIHDVIVSLDGPPPIHDAVRRVPHAFQQLADGVRALRRHDPAYPIAARSTVQKANFSHLRDTVRTARNLELNSISFLAADIGSTAFNRPEPWTASRGAEVALNRDDLARLEFEIDCLIAEEHGAPFVLETPEKLRRIAHHFRAHLGLESPIAPRCTAPWVSAVVESDGAVRPCFFHPPIGNWNDGGLLSVLRSQPAVNFRRNLNVEQDPICRRCVCSLYRSLPVLRNKT